MAPCAPSTTAPWLTRTASTGNLSHNMLSQTVEIAYENSDHLLVTRACLRGTRGEICVELGGAPRDVAPIAIGAGIAGTLVAAAMAWRRALVAPQRRCGHAQVARGIRRGSQRAQPATACPRVLPGS